MKISISSVATFAILTILVLLLAAAPPPMTYQPEDVNRDGIVNVLDVQLVLNAYHAAP